MIKMKIEEITSKVPYSSEIETTVYECCDNYMIKVQDIDDYKSEFRVPAWYNISHLEIRQGMHKVVMNEELLKPGIKCAVLLHNSLLYFGEIAWINDHIYCCVKADNNKNYPFSLEDLIKGTAEIFMDK